MAFDCASHLNPALRDFYASNGNKTKKLEEKPSGNFSKALFEDFQGSFQEKGFERENAVPFGNYKALDAWDDDDYYPSECRDLYQSSNMYTHAGEELVDEELVKEQLMLLSQKADQELADQELQREIYGRTARFDGIRPERKIGNVRFEREFIQEHLEGFGEKREAPQEDQNRKRRLCRHFLKGHCKRGKACDFLHDSSIFCPDLQKVFLGGLPAHITETSLREKLAEQGYQVINRPKVLRGFTPQVCLGSVSEAQRLIEKGKINIDGSLVDVRPYEAFAKDNLEKKLPDDIKRSVFLGGLVTGTTGQRIKDDLEKLDVKVVNHPIIKTGFSPMVTVSTVQQAQLLVKLKKVFINEALVDVRPYVDFRKRY